MRPTRTPHWKRSKASWPKTSERSSRPNWGTWSAAAALGLALLFASAGACRSNPVANSPTAAELIAEGDDHYDRRHYHDPRAA
jgi:hypothetical protein